MPYLPRLAPTMNRMSAPFPSPGRAACARTQALRDLVAETRLRTSRPRRAAVRPRGHRRPAADHLAARRRAAHPRQPARRGRASSPTSASARSSCSASRAQGRRSAAARSILTASSSSRCTICAATSATTSCVMADLCVDEYTDHGHCGVLDGTGASTTTRRSRSTPRPRVAQARAGAHVVAPSGMMDGQVGAIRTALDADGLHRTCDPRLLGQVRERPLRPVPRRRRRADRRRRRPQGLPAGLAQRPRGARRGRGRHRRGRRHGDGQAGARRTST